MNLSRPQLTPAFMLSLAVCSIPGVLAAFVATLGAAFGWGDLSFRTPVYYGIMAVSAWRPVSKFVAWQLWRREVAGRPTCWRAPAAARPDNTRR